MSILLSGVTDLEFLPVFVEERVESDSLPDFRKVPIGIQGLYYGWEMAKWNLFSITGILCAQNLAETLSF